MSPRSSAAEARATRRRILELAVDVASVEGLEGLTIGRLASRLGMSKAGVLGHFGSKEMLQLATVEQAVRVFRHEVWEPAAGTPPGLERLEALCDAWLAYLGGDVFPGGCFLTAAACEFDGRRGAVRDAVADILQLWQEVLATEARQAVAAGSLPAGTEPEQVVFEIGAVAMAVNQAIQLHGDPGAVDRGRQAVRRILGTGQRAGAPAGS